jgi:uncharacterized protein (DUF736 family)
MAYEIREGQGSLWPNEDRRSDNAPNATGKFMINGELFKIAAWTRETRDGDKRYMSLRIEPDSGGNGRSSAPSARRDEPDDDLPF